MAKEFSESFYKSKQWIDCRKAYYQSVLGLCEKCKQPGYILHHKVHLTPENINDPDITMGWDNLTLLCLPCHNAIHGNTEPVRDGLRFDARGNLVKA